MSIDLRQLAIHALGLGAANADAGVHEEGNNNGAQVNFWQKLGGGGASQSWCLYFVFAMEVKAYCNMKGYLTGATDAANQGIMLAHANEFSVRSKIPRTGYCPTLAQAAKSAGMFRDKHYQPSAGDLVLFQFDSRPEPHHVGIIRGTLPDGTLQTIEGNTSSGDGGSQDNGGMVARRQRPLSHVNGFVVMEGMI